MTQSARSLAAAASNSSIIRSSSTRRIEEIVVRSTRVRRLLPLTLATYGPDLLIVERRPDPGVTAPIVHLAEGNSLEAWQTHDMAAIPALFCYTCNTARDGEGWFLLAR